MEPLNEDSPMKTGDLNKQKEAALLCRDPGEDEEPENQLPCAQVNQKHVKKTNKQPTKTQKAKQPVRPVISSKTNHREGKLPPEEHVYLRERAKLSKSCCVRKALFLRNLIRRAQPY